LFATGEGVVPENIIAAEEERDCEFVDGKHANVGPRNSVGVEILYRTIIKMVQRACNISSVVRILLRATSGSL
jgi:hypothetical protein